MTDAGSGSAGSESGGSEPAPVQPDPDADTQLMPRVEIAPESATPAAEFSAAHLAAVPPVASAPSAAEPSTAIDALFGETQFRDYQPGVIDPNAAPFAARSVASARGSAVPDSAVPGSAVPDSSGETSAATVPSRAQKVLLSVASGLVAVLALIALFFLGTRLPVLLGPAPAVVISTPSAAPSPTSTAQPVGPIATGVHPWMALRGGECLDPYTNPWAEKFTVIDCTKPHPAQMVFRGAFDTSTDPGYPGAEKLQAQISLLCAAPGVINLAAAGAYNDVQLQGSYAVTETEWADGEHDYFCFVSRSSGQPLTGSLAVPAPVAAAP